jgi:putative lipoic acid-binding regulatory protein
MSVDEQERFRKRTRWVYYREGVAYGPFRVDEILELIQKRELAPSVEVMEMGSSRRGPLNSVAFFAQALKDSEQAEVLRRDERDFERSRTSLGRSRTARLVLINVALPLLLLGALALGIWYGVFYQGNQPRRGTLVEEELRAPLPLAAIPAEPVAPAPKVVFKEAQVAKEADQGMQDYALKVMAKANQENEAVPVLVQGAGEPKPLTLARETAKPARKAAGGAKAEKGEAGVGEDGAMTFTEDDLAAAPSAKDLVQDRLAPVLDECGDKLAAQVGQAVRLSATVQVKPTGRLASLRLSANLETGLTDTRICVQAGMASIRVPPFEGPAFEVTLER